MPPDPIIIGNATLFLAPCEEVLPHLGKDLTGVMDPPYLFSASGGGKMRAERKCLDAIEADELDEGFDLDLLTPEQFAHLAVFCHNDQIHVVTSYFHAKYGRYVDCGWNKTNPIPVANKHFLPDKEPWISTWRDDAAPIWGLNKTKPSRWWTGKNGRQDVYDHPTVKPIELMRKIVRHVPGDTVVDLFMGTGTTGAAALMEGRKFIGVEKRPRFFAMACHRIERIYKDGLAKPGRAA